MIMLLVGSNSCVCSTAAVMTTAGRSCHELKEGGKEDQLALTMWKKLADPYKQLPLILYWRFFRGLLIKKRKESFFK